MTASPKNNSPALVLASGSPRRKKLLAKLNYSFTVQPSSVNEHFNENERPAHIVQMLALRKAKDIADGQKYSIIIGADTIVVHNQAILQKPESPEEATVMLQTLSNNTHQVLTGTALIKTDQDGSIIDKRTFYESTDVTFGKLEQAEIEQYVASGSPMDKAGAYGIQDDEGAFFVKRIEGDYYNIVGLPLHALYNQLKIFAPELLANSRLDVES